MNKIILFAILLFSAHSYSFWDTPKVVKIYNRIDLEKRIYRDNLDYIKMTVLGENNIKFESFVEEEYELLGDGRDYYFLDELVEGFQKSNLAFYNALPQESQVRLARCVLYQRWGKSYAFLDGMLDIPGKDIKELVLNNSFYYFGNFNNWPEYCFAMVSNKTFKSKAGKFKNLIFKMKETNDQDFFLVDESIESLSQYLDSQLK